MIATDAKHAAPLWLRIFKRLISVLVFAFCVGVGMRHASALLERNAAPAGFTRGMLQGALMPAALPNLLVGNDVSIYNPNNTGVPYKLGYTCGVNVCGALFFGLFFLRLGRLRNSLTGANRE
ncbi:MAG TPA: hypothetical protein VK327_06305 [Candidatus Paceibacterota bacterium]|nr:hypothetical protein [Candidatus Paceibacterota bacterium]